MNGVRSCRICGCTDARACLDGCSWAADRLCSACVPHVDETLYSLELVSGTDHITEDQVQGWTVDQRADAYYWAMAVHYKASDNDVEVPQRPAFTIEGVEAGTDG